MEPEPARTDSPCPLVALSGCRFLPAFLADELYEAAAADGVSVEQLTVSNDERERLILFAADGDYRPPAIGELPEEQLFGNLRGGRSDENGVERSLLGPSHRAVAVTEMHISQIQVHDPFPCAVEQRFDALDRPDF